MNNDTQEIIGKKNDQILVLIERLLETKINNLADKMDERFNDTDKKVEDVNEKVAQVYKVLNGNGKPGLIKKVEENESKIVELTKGMSSGMKTVLVLGGFIILTHIESAVQVIQSVIKTYLHI